MLTQLLHRFVKTYNRVAFDGSAQQPVIPTIKLYHAEDHDAPESDNITMDSHGMFTVDACYMAGTKKITSARHVC